MLRMAVFTQNALYFSAGFYLVQATNKNKVVKNDDWWG